MLTPGLRPLTFMPLSSLLACVVGTEGNASCLCAAARPRWSLHHIQQVLGHSWVRLKDVKEHGCDHCHKELLAITDVLQFALNTHRLSARMHQFVKECRPERILVCR